MRSRMREALEPVVSLWIGKGLGNVERACLRSAMKNGHDVALYCYRPLEGIPDGVTVRDAREVLPESAVIRHKSGSYALFADHFRYRLQQLGLGIWMDCDAYVLAPLRPIDGFLMGYERRERIAVGVLRTPADSPVLPPLLSLFDGTGLPPWLPLHWRLWGRARRLAGRALSIADMPWGAAGPTAFSWLAHHHDLAEHALPVKALYPVTYEQAAWILDPELTLEQMVEPDSVSLHLWNKFIAPFKDGPAPRGSFLARLQQEGAL